MKVSPLCDKWIKNSWFQQAQHNLRIIYYKSFGLQCQTLIAFSLMIKLTLEETTSFTWELKLSQLN